jgi:DUF438 domain-containing protein
MSEFINNSEQRKKRLKELILRLHGGEEPETVRNKLIEHLQQVPYNEVVETEQELIAEGLPADEVLKFCDLHTMVLEGHIDTSSQRKISPGHPVDVFIEENKAIRKVTGEARKAIERVRNISDDALHESLMEIQGLFNQLMDVDKHYKRKEYLVFPYLEKKGITGPPKVMWGKHDEIRTLLRGAIESVKACPPDRDELLAVADMMLLPALKAVEDMIGKEEEILFPMALDSLTEAEWYEVHRQTLDIGYCLYDPQVEWIPSVSQAAPDSGQTPGDGLVRLPSGSFAVEELLAILNTLPVDVTFVDRNDKVKYFSQGSHRIFTRNRAILNRDVRLCHPPGSVHIVEKILDDFKSGRENYAPFWIQMKGRFIHIAYYALRDEHNQYIGTLEVSQDLTELRKLEGERRILAYETKK